MNLRLQRPLVFFDLETTGVNITSDQIVELCIVKLLPDSAHKTVKTYRFNPGIPIPAEATRIHGITNNDVLHSPRLEEHAAEILAFFSGSDIGGFNIMGFDLPFLDTKLKERGYRPNFEEAKIVDPMVVFHKKVERNLTFAYRYYCGGELNNAHSAEADTLASLEVFVKQIELYPELGGNVERVAAWCNDARGSYVDPGRKLQKDKEGELIYAFGKHKGKRVKEELDYATWMLKSDFEEATKIHLRLIVEAK